LGGSSWFIHGSHFILSYTEFFWKGGENMFNNNNQPEEQKIGIVRWLILVAFLAMLAFIVYNKMTTGG